ncbi:MAG TPA: Hsp20/alpha crystallin family protein [Sphingomicrobium sp.]|nr:Hsp20/alpha crystallin family protein [Sphingomicrobium sp.]
MALGYLSPYRRGSPAPAGRGSNANSLFDINREINRMFEALFEQGGEIGTLSPGMLAPALDVHHDNDKIEITAELPGVKEEDIDLTVEDGVLTLRGEKRSQRSDDERGYTERSYGTFVRRISLPPTVDESACSADFENGVLRITLPVGEQKSRGRKIELGSRKSTSSEAAGALIDRKEDKAPAAQSRKQRQKPNKKG